MDVRNWPADQLMQLPDSCFGVRTEIVMAARLGAAATVYVISPMALPDRCVIWQVQVEYPPLGNAAAAVRVLVSLKFGDQLPVVAGTWGVLEDVFAGLDVIGGGHIVFRLPCNLTKLRKLVYPQGRRFVARFEQTTVLTTDAQICLVVSSVPTEVPDCLLSG